MSEAPQRFPLAWPTHKPRTKNRQAGKFRYKDGRGWMVDLTTAMAMERLDREINLLGAQLPILSSNIELKMDGRPRSGTDPADPGVALYFQLKGKPHTMACDTYNNVAQNIAALAAHIESTRAIERYGVATAAEVLQAFTALPPPINMPAPSRPWWEVFGVIRTQVGPDDIQALYRAKAKQAAGDEERLKELNLAKDDALAQLKTEA
ncbi:molecular chaperone [Caulobacter phage Sansa]|uniref:Molecular chaperone n=1 Tax=Caulobacter phage Sansa TaxID=1675600 RepID=A0A0K1LMP9_9CAUD|nr:molecular chaperone [Caulobacter phage Sansa]AKU43478.1 molecular chaperone [Caulobacter phage Sansa]